MKIPNNRLRGLRRVKWISYPVQRQTTCTVRALNIIMIIIIIIIIIIVIIIIIIIMIIITTTSNNQD